MKKSIFIGLLALAVSWQALAQKPVGAFLNDTLFLGKPVLFSLSYKHYPAQDVFFPDSTYDFFPFKFVSESFVNTRTRNGMSLDSVVYTLISFEIDSIQRLRLPVYVISGGDSLAVYSNSDSLLFSEMVLDKDLSDGSLKGNLRYAEVKQDVDYPKILYYLLVAILAIGLFLIFFGRFFMIQYRLWVYKRKHREFVSSYKKLIRNPGKVESISEALFLWKKHMEWLMKKPFTSLTTQEILKVIPNERLEDALKEIDSAIYGSVISGQIPFAFHIMFDLISEAYRKERNLYKENLNSK